MATESKWREWCQDWENEAQNNHTPHLVMLLAGSKKTDQQWASRSPRELNEQPDLEADKELSPSDEERPSSEEPGHQDLRRRTGFS